MKRKFIAYAALPLMGAAVLSMTPLTAAQAFDGRKPTADEIATRQTAQFEREANLLGLSVDVIKAGWAQGKNITAIAAEHGITQDQLKQKIKDAETAEMKAHMQALVDKGVITQDQANQRLAAVQTKMASKRQHGPGFGRGGRMMMR
jgi:hypothetical protein